ncbi:MAG: serpin family protein [Clostridia bacterium]|nr:serpin family protein [Clostridia bacterium]
MKRKSLRLLCLFLGACMLFSCSSCGLKVSARELSQGYQRKTEKTGDLSEDFRRSAADFSFALFRGLANRNGNTLFSPLSAALCLGMVANGAGGRTRTQMETAFSMDIDLLNRNLYALSSSFDREEENVIHTANSIWFRDDGSFHIKEEFLQTSADWYGAQVYAAPFNQSTVRDINAWCKKQTDGMIDKMIDDLDASSLMYLIDALTFDAAWEEEYEKEGVKDGTFHCYDGSSGKVKMLSSTERSYLKGEGATGFVKNYKGERYGFVGLLPDEGTDIYTFIDSLDGDKWTSLWDSREYLSVFVLMPEFSDSAEMKLNDVLQARGMTDMFSPEADFSGMGYSDGGNIYCSGVFQKTYIKVDRHGTKAAAITWAEMKCGSSFAEMPTVVLDRPFVYAIVDNATGLPIFIGAITEL